MRFQSNTSLMPVSSCATVGTRRKRYCGTRIIRTINGLADRVSPPPAWMELCPIGHSRSRKRFSPARVDGISAKICIQYSFLFLPRPRGWNFGYKCTHPANRIPSPAADSARAGSAAGGVASGGYVVGKPGSPRHRDYFPAVRRKPARTAARLRSPMENSRLLP